MSNVERYLLIGGHVHIKVLRFKVASDLCWNCSEIVPQTENWGCIKDIA